MTEPSSYSSRELDRERAELDRVEARAQGRLGRELDRGVTPPPAEAVLIRLLWEPYRVEVGAWLERTTSSPGRTSEAAPWIERCGADVAASAALSAVARALVRAPSLTSLAEAVGERVRLEIQWARCRRADRVAAAKTARNPGRAGGLERRGPILARSLGVTTKMPRRDKVRVGVTLIELLRRATGAIELYRAARPARLGRGWRPTTLVGPSAQAEELLGRLMADPSVRPTHGPMTAPPLPWEGGPVGGGRPLFTHQPLVKSRRQDPAPLEVRRMVDQVQAVAWEVNPDVYWTLRRVWEATGRPVGHVPLRDDLPSPALSPYPTVEERTEAAAVWHQNRSARSRRMAVTYALRTCQDLLDGRSASLWYPIQMDYRGRFYYDVSYLSPQGNDLERGLLRFAGERRPLDDASRGALLVHAANCRGWDKATREERAERMLARWDEVEEVADDPLRSIDLWETADEPWQYLAACQALARGDDGGLPCYSDGTCNGLQVLALLLRDEATAARVNVLPGPRPRDVYAEVAAEATEILETTPEGRRISDWLGGQLPRQMVKRTIMTIPYGVTAITARLYLHEHLEEKVREGLTWPGGDPAEFKASTLALSRAVWEAVCRLLPGAMACREWLSSVAGLVGGPWYWETPLGYRVWQDQEQRAHSTLRTSVFGRRIATSVREGTGKTDVRRQRSSMPPNFVHSLDATCLLLACSRLLEDGRPVAAIHDCLGTRAADYAAGGKAIRRAYAEVFAEDLLESLASQIRTRYHVSVPDPPARGSLDPAAVLSSPSFFN